MIVVEQIQKALAYDDSSRSPLSKNDSLVNTESDIVATLNDDSIISKSKGEIRFLKQIRVLLNQSPLNFSYVFI